MQLAPALVWCNPLPMALITHRPIVTLSEGAPPRISQQIEAVNGGAERLIVASGLCRTATVTGPAMVTFRNCLPIGTSGALQ